MAQQKLFEAVGENMLLNMFLSASVSQAAVCMAVGNCGHTFLDQALRSAALRESKPHCICCNRFLGPAEVITKKKGARFTTEKTSVHGFESTQHQTPYGRKHKSYTCTVPVRILCHHEPESINIMIIAKMKLACWASLSSKVSNKAFTLSLS